MGSSYPYGATDPSIYDIDDGYDFDGYDYEGEERTCDCTEYETSWDGWATCVHCGERWIMTAAQMEAEARHAADSDDYCRREEFKAKLLRPWRWLVGLFPRKRNADEIPF